MKPNFLFLFQLLSFLGAFLLFYLELFTSKGFLPTLGGAHFVWVTCITFFTTIMLLSNGFFYFCFRIMGDRGTFIIFAILGISSLFFFPVTFPTEPSGNEISFLILNLTLKIGLPFFVLSSISPVLQRMSHRIIPLYNPYNLYGISNVGSLAALLFYPLLFEPFFNIQNRSSILYSFFSFFVVIFGILVVSNYLKLSDSNSEENTTTKQFPTSLSFCLIFLSASTTSFFLATTNFITSDIGSAPFFWAVPLGIFLVSFILNFKKNPWRPKFFLHGIFVILIVLRIIPSLLGERVKTFSDILFHLIVLFAGTFEINRVLYQEKPSEKNLPRFYFLISLGGMLGSLSILFGGPVFFKKSSFLTVDFFIVIFFILTGLWLHSYTLERVKMPRLFKIKNVLGGIVLLLMVGFFFFEKYENKNQFNLRNFYGHYRVILNDGIKSLYSGTTLHGSQLMNDSSVPMAYFHRKSPIGMLLSSNSFNSIASVGLGVGNLLGYCKKNQTWDIIEIDKDVIEIAKNQFSFINNCQAKLNFFEGDGRIVLNQQKNKKYDLLIIDAFSGDNIPFHLLTLDSFLIYAQKIKEDGIIVFHISNRFHNFSPLLSKISEYLNFSYATVQTQDESLEKGKLNSIWFFLGKNKSQISELMSSISPDAVVNKKFSQKIKVWTDSYSNFWDTIVL